MIYRRTQNYIKKLQGRPAQLRMRRGVLCAVIMRRHCVMEYTIVIINNVTKWLYNII